MSEFVVGHEEILERLKRFVLSGKLPHALIFSGRESVGKKKVALLYACMIFCDQLGCLSCRECSRLLKLSHPDLFLLSPVKETLGISQIKELQEWSSLAPMEGKAKVAIIDDAHLMTKEAANAFLKTLEEPPAETYFILITHSVNQIIPTILSRCLPVRFRPLSPTEIERISKELGLSELQKRLCVEAGSLVFSKLADEKLKLYLDLAEGLLEHPDLSFLRFSTYFGERWELALFLMILRISLNKRLLNERGQNLFRFSKILPFVEEAVYNYNISLRSLFEYLVLKGART